MPITPTESQLCKQFVKIVRLMKGYKQFPKAFVLIHVANESISTDRYRLHQSQMGLLAGVADYLVLYEGGRVAAIEFKRDNKSKQTKSQLDFQQTCTDLYIPYLLTYQIDQAIEFIKSL